MKRSTLIAARLYVLIFSVGTISVYIAIGKIELGYVFWLLVCQSLLAAGIWLQKGNKIAWWILTIVSALSITATIVLETIGWLSPYPPNKGEVVTTLFMITVFTGLLTALLLDTPAKWKKRNYSTALPEKPSNSH